MVLGVLVMLLAAFNIIPIFLSQLLEWSIYYLNKIINAIASVEQFIIQDIPLHFNLLLSTYLLVITAVIWLKKPSFHKLVLVLVSIMIVQISCLGIQWNTKNEKEWIVFNIKRNTLLAERDGENITIYGNDSLLKTVPKNKTLKSYQIGNLSRIRTKKKLKNLFYFNGNKILIIDSFAVFPKNMKPDILILTQSPKINVERLLQTIRPKIIIADASNYKTIQKQWKATCLKQKIPFHATSEKGYYKLND